MSNEITVIVTTMGGEVKEIQTPVDIRVDDFISELISALKLPFTDSEGNPITWRLDNKSTSMTLDGEKTLGENQTADGHKLYLLRTVTAGESGILSYEKEP